MNSVGERLRFFAETKYPGRGSLANLSRAVGFSSPTQLTQYLNNRTSPGNKLQEQLKELGLNPAWLMYGEGEMLIGSTPLYADDVKPSRSEREIQARRLFEIMDTYGYTRSRFAEVLNIPEAVLSDLMAGNTPINKYSQNILAAGFDYKYISTGYHRDLRPNEWEEDNRKKIPIISVVQAGLPTWLHREELIEGMLAVNYHRDYQVFALKVQGESMISYDGQKTSIPPGSFVVVDCNETYRSGDVVVVKLNTGEQMVKRYVVEDKGRIIALCSNNELKAEHLPIRIPAKEFEQRVVFIGKVVRKVEEESVR